MKDQYLDFAIEIAKKAGNLIMSYYGQELQIEFKEKNNRNIVTDIDKASEKLLINAIKKKFPDHGILAEEGGGTAKKSDFLWILDPIDGTTNFAHGYSFFCVSIGLLYKGKPFIGVIYAPMIKELYTAKKGHGAYLNGKRIHVSKVDSLRFALLATGFSYKNWRINFPHFQHFIDQGQALRRAGSAALDLCHVAAGRLDGYWEYYVKPWDIAAGVLLVEEAGGKVTNLTGAPLNLYEEKILCSNGIIHKKMAAHFKKEPTL